MAPDKFKGSLSAVEVCQALTLGIHQFDEQIEVQQIPLADGGEGTLDILDHYLDLITVSVQVNDPLLRPHSASYKIKGTDAYIEMAQASGLDLLAPEERNCLHTTTYGTGQQIAHAYQQGARRIFLMIGGSATTDGGLGVLEALGIKAYHQDRALKPIGQSLLDITHFQEQKKYQDLEFHILSDVKNPLYGPQGAAYVYAPQKGADESSVVHLDQGLRNFAQVILQQQGKEVHNFAGAGAAGGIAAGIRGFFPTQVRSGIEVVMELVNLEQAVSTADLVISGEGKMDEQTLAGKVIAGVQGLCIQYHKPLGVICGILDLTPEQVKYINIWQVASLVQADTTLQQALSQPQSLIKQRAFEMIKAFKT